MIDITPARPVELSKGTVRLTLDSSGVYQHLAADIAGIYRNFVAIPD